jgi:hypothetical protein
MTHPTPTPKSDTQPTTTQAKLPSPLQSLIAVLISGGIATALYFLTRSIAQTFADKPITSSNPTAINLSVAVRTLVVGMSTLATAVFGIVALGLVIVTIYSTIEQFKNKSIPPSDTQ